MIIYREGFKPAFHFDFVNSVAEKISGYPVETFYQDPKLINHIIHTEDRNLPEQYLSNKIHESDTTSIRWNRRDGQVIWTKHNTCEIYNPTGEIIYIEGIARQVSAP